MWDWLMKCSDDRYWLLMPYSTLRHNRTSESYWTAHLDWARIINGQVYIVAWSISYTHLCHLSWTMTCFIVLTAPTEPCIYTICWIGPPLSRRCSSTVSHEVIIVIAAVGHWLHTSDGRGQGTISVIIPLPFNKDIMYICKSACKYHKIQDVNTTLKSVAAVVSV